MIVRFVVLSLSLAAEPADADAIFVAPPPFENVPAPGQGEVPTNPLIVLQDPFVEVGLVDDGEAIVPSSSTRATSFDLSANLVRVLPAEPLRPNTGYRVISVFEGEAPQELTRFTTGAGPDDDAPSVDVAFVDDGDGKALEVSSDEPFDIVDVRQSQSQSGGGAGTSLFARGPRIPINGSGLTEFSVVVLDRAGNSSEPSSIEADLGCSSTPPSALAPAAVLGVLLLSRRRRR